MNLNEILYEMDFSLEKIENGYVIYDNQRNEYRDGTFDNATEICCELEVFIENFWFADIEDELLEIGIHSYSWEDTLQQVKLHKSELDYVNDDVIGVLECFVNPDKFSIE